MGKIKSKETKLNLTPTAVSTPRNWTTAAIITALKASRHGTDRVAALKRSGILTKQGKLSNRYKNWGRSVTRTSNVKESS